MTGRDVSRMSRRELEREYLNVRALLAEQLRAAPGADADSIYSEGVVSVLDDRPYVHVRAGEFGLQWTPQEARSFAQGVLEHAIEAERDAGLIAFLHTLDFDVAHINVMIDGVRRHRAAPAGEAGA